MAEQAGAEASLLALLLMVGLLLAVPLPVVGHSCPVRRVVLARLHLKQAKVRQQARRLMLERLRP